MRSHSPLVAGGINHCVSGSHRPTTRARVGESVAAEIASLLDRGNKNWARKIEPRDIAVLVNTNSQPGWAFRERWLTYQIPSVVYSAASVLKSAEARSYCGCLLAVAQPTHEKIVRAALATEVFGLSASALEKLSSDEADMGSERSIVLPIITCYGGTRDSCK